MTVMQGRIMAFIAVQSMYGITKRLRFINSGQPLETRHRAEKQIYE